MKMEADVDIASDDDIRVTMMVGIDRGAAAAMAESGEETTPDDLCGQASSDDRVADATVKDVSDDDYVACQMSGTTDLESMAGILDHADGTYVFAVTSSEAGGAAGLGADVFDSFAISVTFPGPVTEHNGSSTVDGTTVTWTDPGDLYGSDGLRAVGKDTASSAWQWVVLAGAGLLGAAAVVLLLVLRNRRGKDALSMQPDPSQPGQEERHPGTPPDQQPPPSADPH